VNYRHAFHAGNFGDCVKHAVLVWLLRALQRKPAPLFVLDTHAGLARYDLDTGPAARTGEWQKGIARLLGDPPPALADYVGVVRSLGLYPGSPAIARALMRPDDRMACCELHPEDAAALRRHFAMLVRGLVVGWQRFRTGVFIAWYPIKQRAPVRQFLADIQQSSVRDVVAVELCLREPVDPARLNGCGMLVVNPPYRFELEVAAILAALLARLGDREKGESTTVVRIVDE
jgi:23S rRNA (adenine2030-N6)-methyltransferase